MTIPNVKCKNCSAEFRPRQIRNNKFCSPWCVYEWRRSNKWKRPSIKRRSVCDSCPECGKNVRPFGFEHYLACSSGHIISLKKVRPIVLRPKLTKDGYHEVGLFDGSKQKYIRSHILVTTAFHGPRPLGMQTRHKDAIRTHNESNNLAWGTPEENYADREIHGNVPFGSKCKHSILDEKRVASIKRRLLNGEKATHIAMDHKDVGTAAVFAIKYGKNWKHVDVAA